VIERTRHRVSDLEARGLLRVEDGNHGEYRPRRNEFVRAGTSFIRAADLAGGRVDFAHAEHINDVALARIRKGIGAPGDVLLSHKGTVGRVALVPLDAPPFVCSPQTTFWRSLDADEIDRSYLRFFLQSPDFIEQLRSRKGETDMADYVSLTEQRRLEVALPPIDEQRAVAEVLTALDDKIESNRRTGQLCADLAEIELAAVLGRDGTSWEWAWPIVAMGDVLEVIETGSRPRGGVSGITRGVPSIGAESIVAAGWFDYEKTKYVTTEFFDSMKRGRLQDGDVLLYKDGGKPGEFEPHVSMYGECFPFDRAAINEHVYRLRVREPYSQELLYFWLRSSRLMEEMRVRGTGVAVPGLNSANVKSLPMLVPDTVELRRGQDLAQPLMTQVLRVSRQTRALAAIRDALLPELLSGRLRVRGAETAAEAVM
jgi:type I restriction enzyme, S subunit